MAYKYSLYPTSITGGPNDHLARSNNNRSVELEEVIQQITIPGSILKVTECRAVIHAFFNIIGNNLAEGIGLNSEYLKIQPGLRGVFEGSEDSFDPDRHRKQVNIYVGNTLRKAMESMEVEKVAPIRVAPKPKAIFDLGTWTSNKWITPNQAFQIQGRSLKFNPEKEDEGVFFIAKKTNIAYRSTFARVNKPSELYILTPKDLPEGSYHLEVRARIGRSTTLTKGRFAGLLKMKKAS